MIAHTKIIVGVTGSIAAYKAAYLVRAFARHGAHVRVAMTDSATRFVAPLTFSSLTGYPVALDMYPDATAHGSGSWHIEWGMWADAMVIAPASAATIAKLAHGLSDNALTVIATALRGRLFVAPAMDLDMYAYPALKANLATLRSYGAIIIPPGTGELASGLYGDGRLAEPDQIVETVASYFARRRSLEGRRVLITAGPTREAIDPVRYLSNHSSGRMGYALADEARDRGADVTVVSGPTTTEKPAGVRIVDVTTADEMAAAVEAYREGADIIIAAAAVSDFAPEAPSTSKLKRRTMSGEDFHLTLRPTPDILKRIGAEKRDDQIVVGFALETENLVESARAKLQEKRCDLVVANSAAEEGAGFAVETNRITLVTSDAHHALPLMSKSQCASEIFDAIERIDEERKSADELFQRQARSHHHNTDDGEPT